MDKEAKISSIVPLFPLPQYVVVLQDIDKSHLVPIWIGVNEGNAIALELQGEKFPRPLTHDLIVDLLEALGATIQKVVVTDLRDNSYYALIHVQFNGKVLEIDARPSDSLAIAVRVRCPIFLSEKVLSKSLQVDGAITDEEVNKFKEALKNMTPEEFFKSLEQGPPASNPFESPQDDEDAADDEESDRP